METAARVRWRAKSIFAIAALIIAGLICLVLSLCVTPGFWASLLTQLSTAFLVGGLWTGVYELYMRRDFVRIQDENRDELLDKISLAETEESLGFSRICPDANTYDYTHLIEDSPSLHLVLNDGRTWVSNHSDALRRRFQAPGLETTVFLLHPDSQMLDVLAVKVNSTRQKLREKIGETVKMLRELVGDETKLRVLGHYLYNPHAVFVGQEVAVVTLYFTSRGRKSVPALVFEDRDQPCFYRKLKEDIMDLEHDADDIFNFDFSGEEEAGASDASTKNE